MPDDPRSVILGVYAAINAGDPRLFDVLDPEIEWITPLSLPWTLPGSQGSYRGHEALAAYFMHCLEEVEELQVEVAELISAGDRILALGYESGRARKTGRAFRARFAQLWDTKNGKVTRLEGFPDTAAMAAAFPPFDNDD